MAIESPLPLGKSTVKLYGRRLISSTSIFGGIIIAYYLALSFESYTSNPFSFSLTPTHSLEAAGIIFSLPLITFILPMSCKAKVAASIVQRVMTSMVYLRAGRHFHYFSVHANYGSVSVNCGRVPSSIKRLGMIVPHREPFVACKASIINLVHNRKLPLCQRDAVELFSGLRVQFKLVHECRPPRRRSTSASILPPSYRHPTNDLVQKLYAGKVGA